MSNQFQSISSGLAELKNYYQGPIIDLLNENIPIYRACEKVKQGWSGAQVNRPLRTVRNQGIGATSDGGVLPKVGRQTTVQATIVAKYNYLRFGVTGPMIKASQSDVGSFVRSAAYELKMGYEDIKTDISRQLSWNGTGTLATVNTAAVASSSLVIAGRTSAEAALKYIDVGTVFDVVDAATGLVVAASGVTVTAITTGTASSATATLTLDQPITVAAAACLVRANSAGMEIQGLYYALDGATSTIYGVDRSTALAYQGNVSDLSTSGNSILSIDAMQNPYNEGLRRGGVGKFNAVWTDFTSLRYYQKLLTPDKRYTNTKEGDATFGNKGEFYLDFNGIPVVPDKDSPLRFAMLPAEVLKMYELCAMEFADETGSMYIAQSDVDALEVRVRHFTNMFNEQPAACGVLQGYTSP
jgi:hypothetical protein